MKFGGALCVFPCVFTFSFFAYWIVIMPFLWYLCFIISVKKEWPEFWHFIFWCTALLLWLVLAILFLIFWSKRYRRRLEKKSEEIRNIIVQRKTDYHSGFEMKTMNCTKPANCKDSDYLNKNDKSKFSQVDVKKYNSVDDTGNDLIQPRTTKAERVLGCYSFDDKRDSNNKNTTEPISVIRSYRQPPLDIKSHKDVNKRKSYDVSINVKIEKDNEKLQKKRNTFHEATSDFPSNHHKGFSASSVDPSVRVFSRDSLLKKDSNEQKQSLYNDDRVIKPVTLSESEQSLQTEKVIFHKVSFKRRLKNDGEKLNAQKNQDTIPEISDSQLSGSAPSNNLSELLKCDDKEDSFKDQFDNSTKNISMEKNEVLSKTSDNDHIMSEPTTPLHSTGDSSCEDPYKGLPQFENFNKYLKLVAIDTPMSPRDSFFSDLIEGGNTQNADSPLPTSDTDVFSDVESPTREYFVADVRPRLSSVKTEAFIIIDSTAETNKLASKSFLLIEDNSKN